MSSTRSRNSTIQFIILVWWLGREKGCTPVDTCVGFCYKWFKIKRLSRQIWDGAKMNSGRLRRHVRPRVTCIKKCLVVAFVDGRIVVYNESRHIGWQGMLDLVRSAFCLLSQEFLFLQSPQGTHSLSVTEACRLQSWEAVLVAGNSDNSSFQFWLGNELGTVKWHHPW